MENYISLYRKYRPPTFAEVVGQKHVVRTLQNAVSLNRISHAYLFAGLRGSGKTTLARIFAKALNCVNGPTPNPCGVCSMCQKIAAGQAIDVFEIDAASNRGIDEIRSLKQGINFVPVEARYKVYIIDEVHMLTPEAFNALLKTLEEPPAHTVFILATTQPEKVPATILSRVQQFDFRQISLEEIIDTLEKIAQKEKVAVEKPALTFISAEAKGSLRDAISLLDEVISYKKDKISVDDVKFLMGAVGEEFLDEVYETLLKKDYPVLFNLIEQAISQGKNFMQVLGALTEYFRSLLFLKIGAGTDLPVSEDRKKILQKKAASISEEFIKTALKKFSETFLQLRWHPHPQLHLELALLDLMELRPEIFSKIKETEPKVSAASEKQPVQMGEIKKIEPYSGQDVGELTLMKIKQTWPAFLEKVRQKSQATYFLLGEGILEAVNNSKIIIKFKKGYSFNPEILKEVQTRELVDSVLKEFFGEKACLESEMIENGPEIPEETLPKNNAYSLNNRSEASRLAQMFGGKIVKSQSSSDSETKNNML